MQIPQRPTPAYGFAFTAASATTASRTEAPGAPASQRSPAGRFAVSSLGALLNMAAPSSRTPGGSGRLLAPHGVVALHDFVARGMTPSPARMHPASGPVDTTAEGLAQRMLDEVGDGEQITLDDTRQAFAIPARISIQNDVKHIDAYFRALDRDGSGGLDKGELTDLMRSYQEQSAANRGTAPRLPPTWA